jgi:hypothetical protein
MRIKLRPCVTTFFTAVVGLMGSAGVCSQAPAGPAITVALEKDVITQEEPVILDIAIHNPTSRNIAFELGYGYEKVKVEVIDPDGMALPKLPPAPSNERLVFRQAVQSRARTTGVNSLLLNEWFNFDKLGKYEIRISVPPSKNSSAGNMQLSGTSLFLTVLPPDEQSLKSACAALVTRLKSRSVADASLAAAALSRIDDPIVVPFLAEAMKRKWFTSMMLAALVRLNTPDAINAIVSASRSSDPEISSLARATLDALHKSKPPR